MFRKLGLFLLVVGVAAAVGAGHFLITGGQFPELAEQAGDVLDAPAQTVKDFFSAGRDRAEQAVQEAASSAARKAAGEAVDAALDSVSLSTLDAPNADAEVISDSDVIEDDIQVFFAPCVPSDPHKIDAAFLAFLNSAETCIYGAFYDLELDAVADALIAKKREGLDVRLVSDSDYTSREAVRACAQAGIPVVFDDRSPFMHNKFCVVDHERVWTGSTNVTENCMYKNNNNAVLVKSEPLAANFEMEFGEMITLKRFGKGSKYATPHPIVWVGDVQVECYFSPDDRVADEIVDEVKRAGRSIEVMAFSFTSKDIAKAIAKRARQGVTVRALFDERQASSQYSQDEYLAQQGAAVYLDRNAHTMHHKVIVIDESRVITGSYNFSNNAEKKNDENVLIIHCPKVAAKYRAEFERLVMN